MRVASYIRRGYGMSRRARIAKKNNEHPISYWVKELNVDNEELKKLLVYVGFHQTGLYGMKTKFYRMPKLNDEREAKKFFSVFDNANPAKKKFVEYLSNYLLESNMKRKLIPIRKI